MKNTLALFILLLFHYSSISQSSPQTKMHRIQDTTKNKSGFYYAKSTEGHFSVLLPIPFNDFTIKADSVNSYVIGSKSQEGIKFSVTEVIKKEKNKVTDLDALANGFSSSANTIKDVKKEKVNNGQSVSFSVTNESSGAILKYVDTSNSLFIMIIEFPIKYKETVEKNFGYFFSSLVITNQ